jgi:hypothetical protein
MAGRHNALVTLSSVAPFGTSGSYPFGSVVAVSRINAWVDYLDRRFSDGLVAFVTGPLRRHRWLGTIFFVVAAAAAFIEDPITAAVEAVEDNSAPPRIQLPAGPGMSTPGRG